MNSIESIYIHCLGCSLGPCQVFEIYKWFQFLHIATPPYPFVMKHLIKKHIGSINSCLHHPPRWQSQKCTRYKFTTFSHDRCRMAPPSTRAALASNKWVSPPLLCILLCTCTSYTDFCFEGRLWTSPDDAGQLWTTHILNDSNSG